MTEGRSLVLYAETLLRDGRMMKTFTSKQSVLLLVVLGILGGACVQVDCASTHFSSAELRQVDARDDGAVVDYTQSVKYAEGRVSQSDLVKDDQVPLYHGDGHQPSPAQRTLPKHHGQRNLQYVSKKSSTASSDEGVSHRNSSGLRGGGGGGAAAWSPPIEAPEDEPVAPGPTFDNSTASIVTAVIGRTAFLPCTVRNLGDRTVSWIRRADLSVLSVGRDRYIQDRRFQVMASAGGSPVSSWALQLAYPNPNDSGVYECQLGSVPKLSRHVTLRVIARTARIWGGPQLYVNSGSGVNLTCQLTGVAEPPKQQMWTGDSQTQHHQPLYASSSWSDQAIAQDGHDSESSMTASESALANGAMAQEANAIGREDTASHVFWYHNGEVVNYEHMKRKGGSRADGGSFGASGATAFGKQGPVMLMSVLRIGHARASDSGNYSCVPSDALPAHITLHVLHGEHPPAAMQDPQPSGASALSTTIAGHHRHWRWQNKPFVILFAYTSLLLFYYTTPALAAL